MSSTADIPKLGRNAVSEIYQKASSLNYLSSDDDTDKVTIFSELKKQPQRYWKVKQINKGGVKRILNVRDNSTGRNVAMAVLQDAQNIHHVENFLREARITALLQHPNIMPVYDIGLNSLDQPYFTMKLVENGKDLDKIIQNHKIKVDKSDFQINDRLELFLKLCDAVAYAHSKGVIHLDLKPANIQIDDFGQLLVCDWGLAKFSTTPQEEDHIHEMANVTSLDFINLTLNGVIKGTPGYMAPEQATLESTVKDLRTDIYSLGAILYALLTFQPPIKRGKLKNMLADTVNGRVIPLDKFQKKYSIADSLIRVVQKAMHTQPDKRYQHVAEMRADIKAYLNGFTTSVENTSLIKEFTLLYKRHKSLFNIILASTATVVAITSLLLYEIRERELHSSSIEQKAEKSEKMLKASLKQLEKEKIEIFRLKKVSAVITLNKGIALYHTGNYKEAVPQILKAAVNNPKLPKAWTYLGRNAMANQSFLQAAVYFQKAIESEKDKSDHHNWEALIMTCHKYDKIKGQKNQLSQSQFNTLLTELEPVIANELLIRSQLK